MITSLHELHKAAKATTSTNEKKRILAEFLASGPNAKELLLMVYDPFRNYYVTSVDAPATYGPEMVSLVEFQNILADANSRASTPAQTKTRMTRLAALCGYEVYETMKLIAARDLQCGVGVTMINEVCPGLIPDLPYMRCSLPAKAKLEDWPWDKGVYSQEKADAMFVNVNVDRTGGVRLLTRTGNSIPLRAFESTVLYKDLGRLRHFTQTHGEIVVYENSRPLPRADSNGVINSIIKGDGDFTGNQYPVIVAWDQIPLDEAVSKGKCEVGYEVRYQDLRKQIGEYCAYLKPIPGRIVYSLAEAHAHYAEVLAEGKEGTIIKHPGGVWKDTTSKECVKFKLEFPVELRAVCLVPAKDTSKNRDTFGSMLCRSEDDLLEVNVQGFTDKKRRELWEIRDRIPGMIMTVKSNNVTVPSKPGGKHSLYLPIFVEERFDKTRADTLPEIQAQLNAAMTGKR